ncbi:heat shock protein 70 [Babesia caballi]|uniref:Heat shock protein 70 n=1 Tax=Babesia caballi TaxID=5871 RepID=A0AAV4M1I2_BABCB|nr:heat shock protein 70 [Babesia caballi]
MDGHGNPWGSHNPLYPRKMIHPKLMPKGQPYMMPMIPQQGVYPKGGGAAPMMMHLGHGMPPMPPARMQGYPEPMGHMPKMMGHPGPRYMHPGASMGPRAMMPHMKAPEHMPSHSPRMSHSVGGAGSPATMGHPHVVARPLPPGHGSHVRVPSPTPMPAGHVPMGMHQGMSPSGLAPSLSPPTMPANRPSLAIVPNNLSPGARVQHFSPDSMHAHGGMVGAPARGAVSSHYAPQMMPQPKMVGVGPPMGMKLPPGPPGGMPHGAVPASAHPHMPMPNRRMGGPKPKPSFNIGPPPHMKSGPPMKAPPQGGQVPTRGHSRSSDKAGKGSRSGQKRSQLQRQREAASSQSTPMPSSPTSSKDGKVGDSSAEGQESAPSLAERMERSVAALLSDQLAKGQGLYGKKFTLSDESGVVSALIEGFIKLLNVLWKETKRSHKYSMDEAYLELHNKPTASLGLSVRREMECLEEFYRSKKDIAVLLSKYRTPSKANARDSNAANAANDKEMTLAMRAAEYAEVGYNQRHLVQKITALDLRNALSSEVCRSMMPESFRLQQIKMATSLHFDSQTPPQCVSPPSESVESDSAESALSKCASSIDLASFTSAASKLMDNSGGSFLEKMEFPMLQMDMRFAKATPMLPTPEMMMSMHGGKQGFPGMHMAFPKGLGFPMAHMPPMFPMPQSAPQAPKSSSRSHGQSGKSGHSGRAGQAGRNREPGKSGQSGKSSHSGKHSHSGRHGHHGKPGPQVLPAKHAPMGPMRHLGPPGPPGPGVPRGPPPGLRPPFKKHPAQRMKPPGIPHLPPPMLMKQPPPILYRLQLALRPRPGTAARCSVCLPGRREVRIGRCTAQRPVCRCAGGLRLLPEPLCDSGRPSEGCVQVYTRLRCSVVHAFLHRNVSVIKQGEATPCLALHWLPGSSALSIFVALGVVVSGIALLLMPLRGGYAKITHQRVPGFYVCLGAVVCKQHARSLYVATVVLSCVDSFFACAVFWSLVRGRNLEALSEPGKRAAKTVKLNAPQKLPSEKAA